MEEKSNIPSAESTDKPQKASGFFKTMYGNLTQKQKQRSVVVLVIVVFFMAIIGLVQLQELWQDNRSSKKASHETDSSSKKQKMSLLNEGVERDLWVAAEGQNIKAIQKSNEELRNEMTRMKEELEKAKKEGKMAPPAPSSSESKSKAQAGESKAKAQAIPVPPPPIPGKSVASAAGVTAMGNGAASLHPAPSPAQSTGIRIIEDDIKGGNRVDEPALSRSQKSKNKETWLPTGSFFKVVLLNGIDAPTSGGAQAEPYPVLMTIQDIATLPNRFKMDMKECFVIGAGYGNISDERAYIRTERLSCVKKNGEAIDFSMAGHIIGEDGKLGMRGRLISKQGTQIAMSIFAGTLGGLGTALKPTGTIKLDIGESSTTTTVKSDVGDVMTSAALGGAGNALERVAQHYLKMAEKMFPIVEIDAGRTVEVVILKGLNISGQDQNLEQRSNNNEQHAQAQAKNKKSTPISAVK